MARERSRHRPAERRGPAASEALPDPIGRLDDVLATLEEMLDGHGISLPPGAAVPAARETPAPPSREPGTLPLLDDVVAPAAKDRAQGAAGGPERDEALEMDGRAAHFPREPLSLGFEFLPDDPLPRIGDLDLGSFDGDVDGDIDGDGDGAPQGERYGGVPPPTLDPEVYRHLIDRLANEIDVIIQTGTEQAMERAAAEIAARVREHVAIILPEVIEELVRMSGQEPD